MGFAVDQNVLQMNGEKSRFNHSNHTLHSDFQIGFEEKQMNLLSQLFYFFKLKTSMQGMITMISPVIARAGAIMLASPSPASPASDVIEIVLW